MDEPKPVLSTIPGHPGHSGRQEEHWEDVETPSFIPFLMGDINHFQSWLVYGIGLPTAISLSAPIRLVGLRRPHDLREDLPRDDPSKCTHGPKEWQ